MKTLTKNLIFLILLHIAFSCKDESTKPETYSVSGTVQLDGETNHANVQIRLFKPVVLDTVLTNINTRYPTIGVKISQRTEFDPRKNTPIYSTTSNGDGSWKIENIEPGSYHVVAEKDSFGFQILYEKSYTENVAIGMQKALYLKGLYQQNISIPEKGFVIIETNTTIDNNYTLSLGQGTTVLFKNNAKLEIRGRLETTGSSSEYIRLIQETPTSNSSIRLENTQEIRISGFIFEGIRSGLIINNCDSVIVENCIFRGSDNSLLVFNSDKIWSQNNLFDSNKIALTGSNSKNNIFRNVILRSNQLGYESQNDQNSILKNNLFKSNNASIGINLGFGFSASHLLVNYNDLTKNQINIRIGGAGVPVATENNFWDNGQYVVTVENNAPVLYDFTKNYWGTGSAIGIGQLIYDKNDDPILGEINFSDFRAGYINW